MEIIKPKFCQKCQSDILAMLVRNITASGISQVYWYCKVGHHSIDKPSSLFIPHEKLKQANIKITDIPIIEDYRGNNICSVCGSPEIEYHHYAPWHLFDNAHRWATGYLCKDHHKQWHDLLTPNMTKRGEL